MRFYEVWSINCLKKYKAFTSKPPVYKTMYKRILDHLNTAILFFDRELILTYINTTGEILLADSAHHLVGHSADELFKTSDPALTSKRAVLCCVNNCSSLEMRKWLSTR